MFIILYIDDIKIICLTPSIQKSKLKESKFITNRLKLLLKK